MENGKFLILLVTGATGSALWHGVALDYTVHIYINEMDGGLLSGIESMYFLNLGILSASKYWQFRCSLIYTILYSMLQEDGQPC